jgi:hypothetical protein
MERTVNRAVKVERVAITVVRCDHCTAIEKGNSYEEDEDPATCFCYRFNSASHSLRRRFAEFNILTIAYSNVHTFADPNTDTACCPCWPNC